VLCRDLSLPSMCEFLFSIATFRRYNQSATSLSGGPLDWRQLEGFRVDASGPAGRMRTGWMRSAQLGQPSRLAYTSMWSWALPNVYWFEMPFPAEYTDRSYFKYQSARTRTATSLRQPIRAGYPIDRAALDKVTTRIDRWRRLSRA